MINFYNKIFLSLFKNISLSKKIGHSILLNNIEKINLNHILRNLFSSIFDDKKYFINSSDIVSLKPKRNIIHVEDIKNIFKKLYLNSYQHKKKIIIIILAEYLNLSAVNVLLKPIEEPPKNTFFIITTNNINVLHPTLLSRVQIFNITFTFNNKLEYLMIKYKMKKEQALKALTMTDSQIFMIDKIKSDNIIWKIRSQLITVFSNKMNILDIMIDYNIYYNDILFWISVFIMDIMYFKCQCNKLLSFIDHKEIIQFYANKYTKREVIIVYKRMIKLNKYIYKQLNINKELAIQTIILEILLKVK